jgi:hypothetical protein
VADQGNLGGIDPLVEYRTRGAAFLGHEFDGVEEQLGPVRDTNAAGIVIDGRYDVEVHGHADVAPRGEMVHEVGHAEVIGGDSERVSAMAEDDKRMKFAVKGRAKGIGCPMVDPCLKGNGGDIAGGIDKSIVLPGGYVPSADAADRGRGDDLGRGATASTARYRDQDGHSQRC